MSNSLLNCRKNVAGLLLTGGSSRRMGRDKASLPAGPGRDGPSLAQRTAGLLRAATTPTLEIGPGFSDLPQVCEQPPGGGPLAALAAGATELLRVVSVDAAIVVATDMPLLEPVALAWLAAHPASASVVPVVDGFPQLLCARYGRDALEASVVLVEEGRRSMRELLSSIDHVFAGPDELRAAGIDPASLRDIDTPADLSSYRRGTL